MSFLRRSYKRIGRSLLCAVLTAVLLLAPALAAGEESAAFSGYLVRLDVPQGVSLLAADEGVESVVSRIGLYRVADLETLLTLRDAGVLLSAEPDYRAELLAGEEDPYLAQQWEFPALGLESVRSDGLDGDGVRIGIIDSGVMLEHEDLVGANILAGHSYIDDNEDVSDEVGHGTFVTGVIAAQVQNGLGTAGMAPGAEIVPLKCFTSMEGQVSDVVAAIWDAVDLHGCGIINLSVGIRDSSDELKAAVDHAWEAGCIIAAAVGNSGSATLFYPAAYDNVIGVGSVDAQLQPTWFTQRNTSVCVVAPGEGLWGLGRDGSYTQGKGTSYSCPMVTAALALAKQAAPELTPQELFSCVVLSARDLGETGFDTSYGYGLLQVEALLGYVRSLPTEPVSVRDGVLTMADMEEMAQRECQGFLAFYGEGGRLCGLVPVWLYRWIKVSAPIPQGAVSAKLIRVDLGNLPLGDPVHWSEEGEAPDEA